MTKLRIDVLSESDKEKIHRSAVTLLEKLGYLCNHPEVLEAFRQAGCKIGNELPKPKGSRKVTFTEEAIADALSKAPSQFTLYPIAPGYREIKFGSGEIYFGTNALDWTWDLETGELRNAVLQDFVAASRLVDACENFDVIFGHPYTWMYDIASKQEYGKYGIVGALLTGVTMLHCGKAQTRVYQAAVEQELTDMLRLWEIAAGGKEAFRRKPVGALNICLTSPLATLGRTGPRKPLDYADWLTAAAKAGVPMRIEPSGLLGLSAPMSVTGAITQDIAEILAVNVAIQAINPGNPMVMSEYSGSADMVTGSKAPPRPEAMLVRLGISAMAQYYNKPSGFYVNSNAVMADSQAAWEHMGIYLTAAMAGVDLTMSGGCFYGSSACCPRQILVDNEIIGWAKHLVKGINMSEDPIPLDLMIETGCAPLGGNFLGAEHTRRLHRRIMWQRSSLTNALGREAWIAQGKKTLWGKAAERARELLQKHKPNIPDSLEKAIREYLSQVLEREGVKGDEAKRIMDKTY